MTLVFSQAAPFSGAAYEYLRADDALPSYAEIAGEQDPLCQVKLFQPGSRFSYYLCAATEYEGIDGPVLTGYCLSPLGRDCDEFGDLALAEIAAVRLRGLPPERDIHFEPMRLLEVEAYVARARTRALSSETRPPNERRAPRCRRKEETCNWPQ